MDTISDLRNELRGDFEQLRGALPNRADWRSAVEQLRSKRERDILGDITQVAQFGPRMLMLQEQANRMPGWVTAGEVPALAALLLSLRPPLRVVDAETPPPLPQAPGVFR